MTRLILALLALGQLKPLPLVPLASKPTAIAASQPVTLDDVKPSAPVPYVATKDGTILVVSTPGQTIADAEFIGWQGTTHNGRCVAILSAPWTTLFNVRCESGDASTVSVRGDSHGTRIVGYRQVEDNWAANHYGILCDTEGKILGANVGYSCTWTNFKIEASYGPARLAGGIYNFENGEITVAALGGIIIQDNSKANFTSVNFRTIPKPTAAPYWYKADGAAPIVAAGKGCRLWFSNCTLDNVPISGPQLCRRQDDAVGYLGPNSVPAVCFVKTPNQ